MPISAEHAGRACPPTPIYRVNRIKIVESAHAIQDKDSACFGDHPVAPPAFAAVIAAQTWGFPFGDKELGLALHCTVHADQAFDFHRPLHEGDDVMARLTIEQVHNYGSLDVVAILVALTVDGEAVCGIRPTLMHTREEALHDWT